MGIIQLIAMAPGIIITMHASYFTKLLHENSVTSIKSVICAGYVTQC